MVTPEILPEPMMEALRHAARFFDERRVPCYLVGGLLRDLLFSGGARNANVDLVIPRGALALTQELAGAIGGAFVPLDEDAGAARVVIRGTMRGEIDLCDFRGATLEDDLRHRDFTINAMAVQLRDWLRDPAHPAPLIDPLNGRSALAARRLQPCFPGTFAEDPIRILRAVRFMAQLPLTLDDAAPALMREAAKRLTAVAGERIRDELIAIFRTDSSADAIRGLERVGVLDVLIPELIPGRGLDQGPFHHLDVLAHQLEAVAQADRLLADFSELTEPLRAPLQDYCAYEAVEYRPRKALIKLAALIHDVGKPSSRQVHPDGEIWFLGHEHTGEALAAPVVERLRLSGREADMVRRLVLHHLRPGFLSRETQLTRRAVYRFFKDLGDDGPACLLEWWSDRMATRGSQSRLDQIDEQRRFLEEMLSAYFFKAEEVVKPPRLLDGHALMRLLALRPGPTVGRLLDAVEEAQAEGRVRTPEQALDLARAMLKMHGKD